MATAEATDGGVFRGALHNRRLAGVALIAAKQGTFWLYAFFGLCAVVFFATLVPETRDRSLEEIQTDLGTDADAALSREREPEAARA